MNARSASTTTPTCSAAAICWSSSTAISAEKAGAVVAAEPGRYAPCAAAAGADDACGAELVRAFGRKAWRRPLTADEESALAAVFASGVTDGGFAEGVARAVEVMLQSPQFLYRIELGRADNPVGVTDRDSPPPGAVALAPYELATRLGYLLWGTAPDDALLALADADGLSTTAAVAAQARRMLDDPRAHEVVAQFHAEWLALDKLDDLDKDPIVFPTFTPELRQEFRQETTRFIDEVVWNREGTLGALLTARYTFADATLASFYGVSGVGGHGVPEDRSRPVTPGRSADPAVVSGGSRQGQPDVASPPRALRARAALLHDAPAAAGEHRDSAPGGWTRGRPRASGSPRTPPIRSARPAIRCSIRSASASSTTTASAAGATPRAASPSTRPAR